MCTEGVRWWYQFCQQAGITWGGGARERAVPTKSWNVRPEWNSCCTLCPDCRAACDSRENNRINNHSHSLSLSQTHWETERPLSTTCCGLWIHSELSTFLSQPSTWKTWKFPPAWFWAAMLTANGRPREAGGMWCRANLTERQ